MASRWPAERRWGSGYHSSGRVASRGISGTADGPERTGRGELWRAGDDTRRPRTNTRSCWAYRGFPSKKTATLRNFSARLMAVTGMAPWGSGLVGGFGRGPSRRCPVASSGVDKDRDKGQDKEREPLLLGADAVRPKRAQEGRRTFLLDRKSTRLNSSHSDRSRMPSSA